MINIVQEIKARRVARRLVRMVNCPQKLTDKIPIGIDDLELASSLKLMQSIIQLIIMDGKANEELKKAKDEKH